MVDEYAMIKERVSVPVAQWIERRSPEPDAQVQFLSGTPLMKKLNTNPLYKTKEALMRILANPYLTRAFLTSLVL